MINAIKKTDSLTSIEVNPSTQAKGSIIWLHGLGADGNDFAPLIPELRLPSSLPLRFVFPNAPLRPVTINNGYVMPAWYDIVSMNINEHADQAGITISTEQINQLIEHEETLGIPADKIILAGFSQGAVIALTAGLRYPKRLGGLLGLSGYLPYADKLLSEKNTVNKTTPIFIAHGTEDTVVPIFLGHSAFIALEKAGYTATWNSYPMGHSVCPREINDISAWLQKCFT